MRFIFSLVFMHVGIMNEASRKLIQKVYSPSQVQEASHLELTKLSIIFLVHIIWYQSVMICLTANHPKPELKKKKKKKILRHPSCVAHIRALILRLWESCKRMSTKC